MSTETAQLFFALLTVAAGVGALAYVGLAVAAWVGNAAAARLGSAVRDAALWIAFLIAATATVGSLYFSESAGFVPCQLCWYQRIAMYPLAPILLVGAIRRDWSVRWYAGPIAAIGAGIAGYHALLEWQPSLDTGACEATGPSCTFVWFTEFGFITLAVMALTGFLAVLALLFVRFPARMDDEAASTPAARPELETEPVP